MDNYLSNLLDTGVVKVKKTKKKIKKSKIKHSSSLKKYKNIQNKKSVNKYISPKIKINKIESDSDLIKPQKKTKAIKNTSKKVIDETPKKNKKKINLTKKKQVKKKQKKDNIEMIEHLRKKGIYVSGKNPKILKDIYIYSLDNNIRIINE